MASRARQHRAAGAIQLRGRTFRFPLCATFNPCYEWAMTCLKFRAGLLSIALTALLCGGCEKKSAVEQVAQDSNNAVKKAGESVKDTANKAKDAVKDTAQKAVDAGKEGV